MQALLDKVAWTVQTLHRFRWILKLQKSSLELIVCRIWIYWETSDDLIRDSSSPGQEPSRSPCSFLFFFFHEGFGPDSSQLPGSHICPVLIQASIKCHKSIKSMDKPICLAQRISLSLVLVPHKSVSWIRNVFPSQLFKDALYRCGGLGHQRCLIS